MLDSLLETTFVLRVLKKREMLEEAGFKVSINKHLLTTECAENDFIHVNHYYECVAGNGRKQNWQSTVPRA